MIRIPREHVDGLVAAAMAAVSSATDASGRRIAWPLPGERRQVEAAMLGALSIIAPSGGPVVGADIQFIINFGQEDEARWPPIMNANARSGNAGQA